MHQRRSEIHRSWRMSRRATVSTLLLCAVLCGVLILLWPEPGTSPRTLEVAALQAARERWAKTGPRHYQLVIDQGDFALQTCRQVLDVRHEQVMAVLTDTCQHPVTNIHIQTITDLFQFIHYYTNHTECGPNGCACDGEILPEVIYDGALGYPQQVGLRLEPPPKQLIESAIEVLPEEIGVPIALTVVRYVPQLAMTCTLMGFARPEFTVVLTPLP
jgi:hypothetical protein